MTRDTYDDGETQEQSYCERNGHRYVLTNREKEQWNEEEVRDVGTRRNQLISLCDSSDGDSEDISATFIITKEREIKYYVCSECGAEDTTVGEERIVGSRRKFSIFS